MWQEHGEENVGKARKEVYDQSVRLVLITDKGREFVKIVKQGLDMITFVFIKKTRMNKEKILVETN